MWSFLKNPQYVPSIAPSSNLTYQWESSLEYSDNFEMTYGWTGLVLTNEFVKEGLKAGLW